MMGLTIDLSEAAEMAERICANEQQLKKALSGALTDTGKSAVTAIKKQVAASTKVSQKRLGVRIKKRHYQDDGRVVLWVGAGPVPLHTLGDFKYTTLSVKAGNISRRGAFSAHIAGGGLRAFIREKSAHYTERKYGDTVYGIGYKKSSYGRIKSRFPVRLAVVRIDNEVETAIATLDHDMTEAFDENFLRRIKYEVLVKGAKT